MLAIKVYNALGESQLLDLPAGASLALEALMPAFDLELEEGEFSLPISVPMTDRNRRFLGFPENFNTGSGSIIDNWRCDVYSRDLLQISGGNLKLLSFEGRMEGQAGVYSFNISGIKSLYGQAIKGKRLRELQLCGLQTWDPSLDCRAYAKYVMEDPNTALRDCFTFPPVVIEDYFDTTRDDYNNETLTNNTVNNVVANPGYPNGWDYGVEDPMAPSNTIPSGVAGYEQHRTVPFFRLAYVLRQCFLEFGWKVSGSFFNLPEIENLLLFNNCSLEKYDPAFPVETGRSLNPANHLPDLSVYEFVKRVQNAFNLKLIYSGINQVHINLREAVLSTGTVKDYTPQALVYFNSAQRNPMFENGFTLQYLSDGADNYWSDRVKDPAKLNVVGSVNLYTDIPSLGIGSPASDMYVYVAVENYYYNYNEQTARWEPYSEGLWEVKRGKGEVSLDLGFAPLCEHYLPDAWGTWTKRNVVATRQKGSYLNSLYKLVENEFGLRFFFQRLEKTGSYFNLPRSYCHNYNADGTKIGPMSLSLSTEESLYNLRWKAWIFRLLNSWDVQARLQLTESDLYDLSEQDLIQILQNQFVIRRISYDLPLLEPVAMELVKL